jgi:hypothetical protein
MQLKCTTDGLVAITKLPSHNQHQLAQQQIVCLFKRFAMDFPSDSASFRRA